MVQSKVQFDMLQQILVWARMGKQFHSKTGNCREPEGTARDIRQTFLKL